MSLDTQSVILEIAQKFNLKKDKIDPPEVYLGGRLAKKSLNGQYIWTMSSSDYIESITNNIKVRCD